MGAYCYRRIIDWSFLSYSDYTSVLLNNDFLSYSDYTNVKEFYDRFFRQMSSDFKAEVLWTANCNIFVSKSFRKNIKN